MPILGLCQWRTIPTRRPAPAIARRLPVPDKAGYGPNNAGVDDGYPLESVNAGFGGRASTIQYAGNERLCSFLLKLANSWQIGFLRDIPRRGESANHRVFTDDFDGGPGWT